jgi:NAD(P)-dependent dehydrogenase (short-subunit alcohol dehydrogenase family)
VAALIRVKEKQSLRLEDKVVIVTGGASGMGRAYALGVAAEGARVVVADIADPQATVKEIEAGGGQGLGILCDVSREEDTLRLAAEALGRFGRIDVLVNNAALYGTLRRQPFTEIPVEEWDRVMAVNLRGLFLCARAVFPAMKTQGKGKIINISSGTFFKGVPNYIHYTTSKGGVVGFTRSLARELGDFGVRVNAVAPGFTLSGENELHISAEEKDASIRMRMLKRAQVPADVVGTIVFLASDDSDFITGQTLSVDGGSIVH